MLKQIITPEDKFFATEMRSTEGRKRLEKAVRRSRIQSVVFGLLGIGFVALTASTVADEFRNQLTRPNEDLSGGIRSALLLFGLSIAVLSTFAIRWHTLTTELKYIVAWPSSPSGPTSELADNLPNAREEVKS